jgi:Zn finger protein HypA/HybF involved in hydrogenase expression
MYECVCFKCNKSFFAESKRAGLCPKCKTWGDHYREAKAAGMDDASACHAADTAVP